MGTLSRDVATAAQQLKPTIVSWLNGTRAPAAGGGSGGGLAIHALDSAWHTGTLAESQAPWAATVTALNTHIANPDAHHARLHDVFSASDHTGTGAALDLVGFTGTNTIGKLTPSNNPGAAAAILKSDASGFLALQKLTTPAIDTAAGNLTLSPASGFVTLPADGVVNTASGGLSIVPAGDLTLNPGGSNVLPGGSIEDDLGDYNRKWRSLYAAELYVETLVAQDVLSTIGGRIMVAPTTTLIADVAPAATTVDVKHNIFASGDFAYMASAPGGVAQVEALKITSAATPITGGYRYSVTRNQDGSGANTWVAGDALAHTGGAAGEGYFDITATQTIHNHLGPTIAGYVRTGTGAWNTVKPVTAQGNLRSFVDYAADEFGFAVGNDLTLTPTTGFKGVTVDRTGGARFFNTDINLYSGATLKAKIQNDGQFFFGALTGARLQWDNTDFKGIDAGGVAQWYGRSTDGRFYAGAGKAWLDVNGLSLLTAGTAAFDYTYALNWYATVGGTRRAGVGAWTVGGATVLGLEVNSCTLSLDQAGRLNLATGATVSLSSVTGSYTNVVNNLGVGLAYDTTPSARLHVYGTTPVVRLASAASDQTIELNFYDADTTRKGRLLYAGANASPNKYFGFVNEASDGLWFLSDLTKWLSAAGSEFMRLNSDGLGIGGTPGTYERLRIQGGAAGTDKIVLKMQSSNAYGPLISLQSGARDWELRSSYSSDSTSGAFEVINRTDTRVAATLLPTGTLRLGSADANKSAHIAPRESIALTNGQTATFASTPAGLVVLLDIVGNTVGLYLLRGSTGQTPVLVSETPVNTHSPADTAGRSCFYWDAGASAYVVKNRTGGDRTYCVVHLGSTGYA